MGIKPLHIKQHDLQPYYPFGVPGVDLTGATITCTMVDANGVKVIDRQSAGMVITNGAAGEAEYRWQPGETDAAGTYTIEFEITPQVGGKFSVPSGTAKAMVVIVADLNGE